MKKLLMSLMSVAIISSTSGGVIACNKSADLYSTISFGEKVSSLKELNGDLLRKSGMSLSSFYADDVLEGFVNGVRIGLFGETDPTADTDDKDDAKDNLFEKLKENARGIFFSNDFLFQLSKVPGYHWIIERIREQSAKFDLYYHGTERGKTWTFKDSLDTFSRFISSWMSRNDWGVSVTFFDQAKMPWHGAENPEYARININQRVLVEGGSVVESESILSALHADANGKYQVFPGLSDQGYIYQGYVYGTDLINIHDIMSEDTNESAQIDLLSYTPSAYDIVNNSMSNATVDDIISNFSGQFTKDVDDMLTNNPIYFGDETKNKDVLARFSNTSFVTLFKVVLTRREMESEGWKNIYAQLGDDYKDDESKISVITGISNTVWNDISILLSSKIIPDNTDFGDYKKEQVAADKALLKDWMGKDKNNSIKENKEIEDHIDELAQALLRLAHNTRTNFTNSEEYQVCQSAIINVLPFFYQGTDLTSIKRLDEIDLTEYGNNNDYNFAELIFGSVSDLSHISDKDWMLEHQKQLYNPDLTNSGAKMADKGFKNVSVRKRFSGSNSIFSQVNTIWNTTYRPWMVSYSPDSIVATPPLNPGTAKQMSDKGYGDKVANPTDPSWFNEGFSSFLKQNGIEGHGEDITLSMLGQNYDSNIRALVQKYFTFENDSMMIWNINGSNDFGLSADRKLDGAGQNHASVKYDSKKPYDFDDDIAFSDIAGLHSSNGNKNPLVATEWNSISDKNAVSSFRNRVYEMGFNDLPHNNGGINPVQFNVIFGSVNSFGEATNQPINYSTILEDKSLLNNSVSYDSFVQTNLRGTNDVGQPYADAIQKFWEYWVWKNPDKKDGYNPNAGERPNYDN